MATQYFVQTFRRAGRKLVADQPQSAKTAEAAVSLAQRQAATRAGVVAFSQQMDVETDSYDDPVLLFMSGDLPPELSGA